MIRRRAFSHLEICSRVCVEGSARSGLTSRWIDSSLLWLGFQLDLLYCTCPTERFKHISLRRSPNIVTTSFRWSQTSCFGADPSATAVFVTFNPTKPRENTHRLPKQTSQVLLLSDIKLKCVTLTNLYYVCAIWQKTAQYTIACRSRSLIIIISSYILLASYKVLQK